jgi:outer membrane protein assembly factor BamB
MPSSARHVLAALAIAACAATPLLARNQKSVFHGLAVEPESGMENRTKTPQIGFERSWSFAGFVAPLAGDPVAVPPYLAATDRSGQVVLLDEGTGAAAWSVPLGEAAALGPAVDDGVVYQGTVPGTLAAIAVEGGAVRWRSALGGAPLAPPLSIGGRLYVVTDTPEILAVDPSDGTVLGRETLPGRPLPPATDEDRIVVGTGSGSILSFDPATLAVEWQRELGQAVTSPPIISGKRVFVGSADRAIRSLRTRSGHVTWRQRTGSIVTARARAIGGLLYVPCWDNDVYVLREHNGHLLGRARLEHRLTGEVAWQFEHLFVAPFTEGSVVALALPYLGTAGKHELGVPGEWFTTAPVPAAGGIAVGWGRDSGHLLALKIGPPPEAPAAEKKEPAGKVSGTGDHAGKEPAGTPAAAPDEAPKTDAPAPAPPGPAPQAAPPPPAAPPEPPPPGR